MVYFSRTELYIAATNSIGDYPKAGGKLKEFESSGTIKRIHRSWQMYGMESHYGLGACKPRSK